VTGRSDIGFLIWDRDEEKTRKYNLGSRIKTPTYPMWVTKCNEQGSILRNSVSAESFLGQTFD
jgi:hypothetical protein